MRWNLQVQIFFRNPRASERYRLLTEENPFAFRETRMTIIAGSLPHELLQPILRHIVTDSLDVRGSPDWLPLPVNDSQYQYIDFPRDPAYKPFGHPRSLLLSSSRINRHWSDAANAILFESISVRYTRQVDALYRVLTASPMHTSLVRCLDFGSYRMPHEEPNVCAEIIKACTQVQHLCLGAHSRHSLPEIRMALPKCVHLRTLCLHPTIYDNPFLTMSELLELMTHWPHLENLYLYRSSIAHSILGIEDELPSPLPSLKGLVVWNRPGRGPLRQLLSLSQNTEQLSVVIDEEEQTLDVLNTIQSSIRTLRHLHLQFLCFGDQFQFTTHAEMPLAFYTTLPTLTNLRYLKLTDTFFPPNLLTKALPSSLEILIIFLFPDDYPMLASALEDRGWLPNLRSLNVQGPSPTRYRSGHCSDQKESTERVVVQCGIRECELDLMVLG
ncbi:hypothetical protein JAAARDRAFT_199245 [Jaapia argillacea MUCL 33604]|uniref:F-box domain-containing protein n=1 Tax=Jaapia argillacea MUCL 33604 TaxID=933084 RepID=A0A067P8U4_9AGAM|nr:hypothetical protein JAAARDRAFT_199245 [Jaapia argillacea MUCL 33604]